MKIRAMGLDLAEQLQKEFQVHLGMNAAYDMHLRDGLAVIAFYDVQHLLHAQLPTLVAMRIQTGIGTKMTGEYAHIGGLDMEIAVEIRLIAMLALPYMIGKGAEKG